MSFQIVSRPKPTLVIYKKFVRVDNIEQLEAEDSGAWTSTQLVAYGKQQIKSI